MLYFIMVLAILVCSKVYYTRTLEENLFRKYKLNRFSAPEKIRELYRSLARQSHPDMRGGRQDFVRMNAELKTLMNDRQRWFYDRFGRLSDGSSAEEQSEQVGYAIQVFMQYLQKAMFVVVFVQNDLNLNTRMSALGLVLAFLLFDLYNITARRMGAKDPLDYIYYDFTLQERSTILRSMFDIFFFLMIAFKFAFEELWVMSWMKWVSHAEVLQLALYRKTTGELQREFVTQNQDLVAGKLALIQSLDLTVTKRPADAARGHQAAAMGQPRVEGPDDLGRGRIFAEQDRAGPDRFDDQLRGHDPLAEQRPEDPQQVDDPRDTSLWSMVVSLLKGIATFYAINMGIQFLFNL
jgi:hypothetical protein